MTKARICSVPYDKRTWDDVVNTNPNAKPQEPREVKDAMVIHVDGAMIRSATVNGIFEIADVPNPFTYQDGSLTVKVNCRWYGLYPEGGENYLHLRISNSYMLNRNYSGDVVANIEEI